MTVFSLDKYESFIDPSIAGKDCSLTILNPSNSRISARGNVALSNFACEDAFVEINGQKFCGNEEVDVEINDQFDLIFFGNFATGSSPPGVGSIRIDVYNH
ncbi:Oidioi.mRNA.OKI2018_I69.chr1.g808.t1.cds [Oikopleura dioica]|uniref:Oidioi.mRNA.OKI2018_I69.chr1.g808.t1.cds n=1 Tax=Oikopleura dioica TaxID=34765 RepID=A0ABN7SR71_OIKDI|nr:Oidioi.mRNA.OKI2018_I69.chr1.g808.t1.cds [Oikopleura dioica]